MRIHRQADRSDVIKVARSINAGENPSFPNGSDSNLWTHHSTNATDARDRIVHLVSEAISDHAKLPAEGVQVVAPMKSGAWGVDALNEALRGRLLRGGRNRPN